jgi:FtsZ-binding cell division protein ZapB
MDNNNQQNKGVFAWVGLVIMTLATGALGFLYFDQKKQTEGKELTIVAKAKELAFTQTKLDSVSRALDEKIAEVEKLGGDLTELLKVKSRLEADKVALRKGNKFEMAKYETKIKEYESFLATKDVEIAKLKEENGVLLASNQTLSSEVGTLKTEREELTKTKQQLSDSVVTYVAKNRELSDKVAIGAALKAENLKVLAVTPKGKVKEDDRYRAKRVDKLKVLFTLPSNPLTAQEEKEIIVRVLDPEGAVLSDEATGSGKFSWKGQDMLFTTKNRVAYQNSNQMVEMVYDNPQKLRSGKYSVELYAEGFQIGSGNFVIR